MNADLHIGATEGSFKKVIRDRGGFVEGTTYEARKPLNDTWYGIHEVAPKMSGDGVVLPTRDFVETPLAQPGF
jgi:hypothetical protein